MRKKEILKREEQYRKELRLIQEKQQKNLYTEIIKCPKCNQKLRISSNENKLNLKCPKCFYLFSCQKSGNYYHVKILYKQENTITHRNA